MWDYLTCFQWYQQLFSLFERKSLMYSYFPQYAKTIVRLVWLWVIVSAERAITKLRVVWARNTRNCVLVQLFFPSEPTTNSWSGNACRPKDNGTGRLGGSILSPCEAMFGVLPVPRACAAVLLRRGPSWRSWRYSCTVTCYGFLSCASRARLTVMRPRAFCVDLCRRMSRRALV